MDTKTNKKQPKKVKTMRMSGMPVNLEDFQEFNEKWKKTFDKVIEKYGQDMQKVHLRLERYDRLLRAKYNNTADWAELKTLKQWKKKVTEYGPIMVARERDTEEILYVIADQNLE